MVVDGKISKKYYIIRIVELQTIDQQASFLCLIFIDKREVNSRECGQEDE